MNFGVQQLQETLEKEGYRVLLSGIEDTLTEADRIIFLNQACDSTLRKEGFLITTEGNRTMVRGNDGNGVIYACRELIDHINEKKNLDFPAFCQDAPEMVLRELVSVYRKLLIYPDMVYMNILILRKTFLGFMINRHGYAI